MINEINTAFPWYDSQLKQARNKNNCSGLYDFALITPNNALLPFQFKRVKDAATPVSWVINTLCVTKTYNLNLSLGQIKTRNIEGQTYYYYDGAELTVTDAAGVHALLLPPGKYESVITYSNGLKSWSETYIVPQDNFKVSDISINYLKFVWYNSGDIRPFYYGDKKPDGTPVYKNAVYLQTFITSSEPTIYEVVEKDTDQNEIPVLQRVSISSVIHTYVPDYLKLALVIMQIHKSVFITTALNQDSGQIVNINTDAQVEAPGCMAELTLTFDRDLALINRICDEFMQIDA
jgi:hypothetical protein